jgi:hypothetical protein
MDSFLKDRIENALEDVDSWGEIDSNGWPNTSALSHGIAQIRQWADASTIPLIKRYLENPAGPYEGLQVAVACCEKFGPPFLGDILHFGYISMTECQWIDPESLAVASACAQANRDFAIELATNFLATGTEDASYQGIMLLVLLPSDRGAYGMVRSCVLHPLDNVATYALISLTLFDIKDEVCRDILDVIFPGNGTMPPTRDHMLSTGISALRYLGTPEALAGLLALRSTMMPPQPQLDEAILCLRRHQARIPRRWLLGIMHLIRFRSQPPCGLMY